MGLQLNDIFQSKQNKQKKKQAHMKGGGRYSKCTKCPGEAVHSGKQRTG